MGLIEDILSAAGSAGEAVFGPPGSGSATDVLTQNSPIRRHARLMEIEDFARQQGYGSTDDPRPPYGNPDFARDFPDLAAEAQDIMQGLVMGAAPVSGALGPARAARGALPPPRGAQAGPPAVEPVPPPQAGIPHPQGPQGGTVPSSASTVPGTAPAPGPIGPTPARVNGGIPMPGAPAPSPAPGGGFLGQVASQVRSHPGLLAGAGVAALPIGLGVGAAQAGMLPDVGTAVSAVRDALPEVRLPWQAAPPQYGPSLAEADANAARIAKERAAAEEKARADEASARRTRGLDADISLTESQAAYYRALYEKALKDMADQDLPESMKLEIAHKFAMQQIEAKARADLENTMVREAGDNERTERRERGADTRARYQADVEMRGQDQQARDAQDRFVAHMLQNQIANGQLSLERASKMFEAYQKQQKLPAEILQSVASAFAQAGPYLTNRESGESAPGFEKGGPFAALAKEAGIKFDPSKYRGSSDVDFFEVARGFGAVPNANAAPPPTVDQVFAGAGQGADLSPEGQAAMRSQSASNLPLPRPRFSDYTDPMPDDIQQRILSGVR